MDALAARVKASELYAKSFAQNPQAVEFYTFLKSMDTYRSAVGKDTTLLLSTESELFRFLKRAGLDAPRAEVRPRAGLEAPKAEVRP